MNLQAKILGLRHQLDERSLALGQAIDNGLHGQSVDALKTMYGTLHELSQVYVDLLPDAYEQLATEVGGLKLVKAELPKKLDQGTVATTPPAKK